MLSEEQNSICKANKMDQTYQARV